MAPSKIDLNEMANKAHLNLTIASIQEEHPADGHLRRTKDFLLFITALLMVLCGFIFCGHFTLNNQFGNDEKKWAMLVASSIISAFVGFLTGKKIK